MKKIKIEIETDNVTLIQERAVGVVGALVWYEVERQTTKPGNTSLTFLLEDNERIIIEPHLDVRYVVDKVQNSVSAVVFSEPAEPLDTTKPQSAIGVWREAGEQPWSRTGARYRKD